VEPPNLFDQLRKGGDATVLYQGSQYPVRVVEVNNATAEVEYENGDMSTLSRGDAVKCLVRVQTAESTPPSNKRSQSKVIHIIMLIFFNFHSNNNFVLVGKKKTGRCRVGA